MKTCSMCKVSKPYSEFNKARLGRQGFDSRCRACVTWRRRKSAWGKKVAKVRAMKLDNARRIQDAGLRLRPGHGYDSFVIDRYFRFADVGAPNECWAWTGAAVGQRPSSPSGYGRMQVRFVGDVQEMAYAHRMAYELFVGPLGDLFACHTCDNSICVNPHHIFAGDAKDNARDMVNKGRGPKSELFTAQEVTRLRHRIYWTTVTASELADELGVSTSTLTRYITGDAVPEARGPRIDRMDKYTPGVVERMVRMRAAGKTLEQVAEVFDSHFTTVSRLTSQALAEVTA